MSNNSNYIFPELQGLIESSLELFKAVPTYKNIQINKKEYNTQESNNAESNNPESNRADSNWEFIPEYGIAISPSASFLSKEIKIWLKNCKLTGEDLNKSFHKNWKKVISISEEQHYTQQILHYLGTYGLNSIGLPEQIILPIEEFQLPDDSELKITIIHGINNKEEIIDKCFDLLSGLALKQTTLENIFNVLHLIGYEWTGKEIEGEYNTNNKELDVEQNSEPNSEQQSERRPIKNREAQLLIYKISNTLPIKGEDLLKYFVYDATGQTCLVKNKKLYELIKYSNYILPNLSNEQLIELSKSFNRFKEIWLLGFKKVEILNDLTSEQFKPNASIVNKLNKLSKVNHIAQPENILLNLTSKFYNNEILLPKIQKANIYQLIRLINVLRLYQCDSKDHFYKIRNGKGFPREKENSLDITTLKRYEELILSELKSRLGNKKVYCPENISYALPVSEKMFSGYIPKGTRISVNSTIDYSNTLDSNTLGLDNSNLDNSDSNNSDLESANSTILFGIYWENKGGCKDLDLSAINSNSKIGWNSEYKSSDLGLLYSGDITSAPEGATEWIYGKTVDKPYILAINLCNGEMGGTYKIMIATSSEDSISSNYICHPNDIILEANSNINQKQTVMGIIVPRKHGAFNFYIVDQGMPGGEVSSYSEKSRIAQQALFNSVTSQLYINELFEVTSDKNELVDVNLDPKKLTSTTFIDLLNEADKREYKCKEKDKEKNKSDLNPEDIIYI